MHERCGHCIQAEKVLAPEIASGEIKVFEAHIAHHHNHNPEGFPFFVNPKTGQSQTGWPGSKEKLYQMLGVSGQTGHTAWVGPGGLGPNAVGPKKIDPNRIDPNRIDPNRFYPKRVDPNQNDPKPYGPRIISGGCGRVKERFEENVQHMCTQRPRGYVTLSQTWIPKKEYSS